MKLTRISWPIHEYDSCRVAAQNIANATQNNNTSSEKIEVSPNRGTVTVFWPQLWPFLLIQIRIKTEINRNHGMQRKQSTLSGQKTKRHGLYLTVRLTIQLCIPWNSKKKNNLQRNIGDLNFTCWWR